MAFCKMLDTQESILDAMKLSINFLEYNNTLQEKYGKSVETKEIIKAAAHNKVLWQMAYRRYARDNCK